MSVESALSDRIARVLPPSAEEKSGIESSRPAWPSIALSCHGKRHHPSDFESLSGGVINHTYLVEFDVESLVGWKREARVVGRKKKVEMGVRCALVVRARKNALRVQRTRVV